VPKNRTYWFRRATILDHETGFWYTTDAKTYKSGSRLERYRGEHNFVRYEREDNTFVTMNAKTPVHPNLEKSGPLRAHTSKKDDSGAFWCFGIYGTFFKFYPEEDRVEDIGLNWGMNGTYIMNMHFSPGKRYIYYVPRVDGVPIVQYDTETGTKKVLAFLDDFYREAYGFSLGSLYGFELDENGESLFFYTGGEFVPDGEEKEGYTRPAMFHVHIPASEREE
jgi:hypothetical protein